jgi:hypothetical protein
MLVGGSCARLLLARNRHAAMSEMSLLSGVNRTSRLRAPTSEFDPTATLGPTSFCGGRVAFLTLSLVALLASHSVENLNR